MVFMIDKSLGFILTSKTKEIDVDSTLGEFGVKNDDHTPSPKKKSKKKKEEETIVSSAIRACADAMNTGMEKLADTVLEMGTHMRPDPAFVDGEKWKLIDQLECKINKIEESGNLSEGVNVKLARLRSLLTKKETEFFEN